MWPHGAAILEVAWAANRQAAGSHITATTSLADGVHSVRWAKQAGTLPETSLHSQTCWRLCCLGPARRAPVHQQGIKTYHYTCIQAAAGNFQGGSRTCLLMDKRCTAHWGVAFQVYQPLAMQGCPLAFMLHRGQLQYAQHLSHHLPEEIACMHKMLMSPVSPCQPQAAAAWL